MRPVSKLPSLGGTRWLGPATASLLVHVGLGVGLATSQSAAPAEPVRREVWSGETFDIDATPTVAAAAPSPAPQPAAEPAADVAPAPSETGETSAVPAPPPAPARKPRATPPAARQNTVPGSSETGEAPAPTTPGGTPGSFGAAGLPPGVRDLPTAFTRAIPPAASRDAAFRDHELGELGEVRVLLRLDEAGRIISSEIQRRPGEQVPPLLERLSGRIVALLGGGQFALRERTGRAAQQILSLSVRLESREPSLEADANETVRLGFDAPSDGKPGRAFFTLGSGRHFEARVQLLATP